MDMHWTWFDTIRSKQLPVHPNGNFLSALKANFWRFPRWIYAPKGTSQHVGSEMLLSNALSWVA